MSAASPDGRRLLVVAPDAEARAARLAPAFRRVHVQATPAASRLAAEAHLAGGAWDALALAPDAHDADALAALAERLGTAVVHLDADLAAWLGVALAAPEPTAAAPGAAAATLARVAERLAHVAHSLSNPLAVVSGHAQLGREMVAMLPPGELADDLASAFDGVEAGARSLVERLGELDALRREIEAERAQARGAGGRAGG